MPTTLLVEFSSRWLVRFLLSVFGVVAGSDSLVPHAMSALTGRANTWCGRIWREMIRSSFSETTCSRSRRRGSTAHILFDSCVQGYCIVERGMSKLHGT